MKADLFQTDFRVLQERAGSLPSWALRKSACQRQFAENRAIVSHHETPTGADLYEVVQGKRPCSMF
jgi:hypothetical protein